VEPRIARRAAAAALLAGIGADILFDRTGLGINVPLGTVAALAIVTWFGPRHRPADPIDLWFPATALAASLGPALRTDPTILPLDIVLIAAGVTAFGLTVSGVAVTRRSAAAVALMGALAGTVTVVALAWLVARSGTDGFFSRGLGQLGRLAPVVRGGLIALPVLAGFSLLLASADAVFGRALDEAFKLPIDLGEAFDRGLFSVIAAGLIAGPIALAAGASSVLSWVGLSPDTEPVLHAAANGATSGTRAATPIAEPAPSRPAAAPPRLGATEALVVLLAVDLLFAAFALIQVVYLFGGVDTLAVVGMTYSDYARQGYFQLVGVVALAGLLLLGAHEIAGRSRSFLVSALALLVLTAVILASAAFRLALYQGAYGWTELRFFVAASIGWLGLSIGLAVGLLLIDRMRWLPHTVAIGAVAVTLAISAIGPQAFITHENLARVAEPGRVAAGGYTGFDADYVLSLGDDAIPDLVAALAYLPSTDRTAVLARLRTRQQELGFDAATKSPLAWNLARERARAALAELPGR
jgi:two-component system sensor histidine kinase BaeS